MGRGEGGARSRDGKAGEEQGLGHAARTSSSCGRGLPKEL